MAYEDQKKDLTKKTTKSVAEGYEKTLEGAIALSKDETPTDVCKVSVGYQEYAANRKRDEAKDIKDGLILKARELENQSRQIEAEKEKNAVKVRLERLDQLNALKKAVRDFNQETLQKVAASNEELDKSLQSVEKAKCDLLRQCKEQQAIIDNPFANVPTAGGCKEELEGWYDAFGYGSELEC